MDTESVNLGYLLWAALRKQQKLVESAIRDFELSLKEYSVLMALTKYSGLTQLETGQLLQIDRTSIGHLVDSLCAKDLVERKTSAADRRAYLLYLTAKGIETTDQLLKIADICTGECLKPLTGEEKSEFLRTLKKISEENEHE